MSGTTVFYNGVLMQDCDTSFQQVIEYDKESGKDAMFSRFRITVASNMVSVPTTEGFVEHPSTIKVGLFSELEAANNVEHAVDRLAIARSRLQEPKKDFWFAIHGTSDTVPPAEPTTDTTPSSGFRIVLAATGDYAHKAADDNSLEYPEFIRAYGFDGTLPKQTNAKRIEHIDPDDGPRTSDVDVVYVGGRFMRVTATFDVCLCLCRDNMTREDPPVRDARKVEGVITNKWSMTESTDGNMRTTHNISGLLRVKNHRYKAQAMRTMVHPLLFPYAKMESRTFGVDHTGHELTYNFVIREAGNAPPPGIVDWDGSYTESSGAGGGKTFGSINLSVTGSIKRPPNMTAQQQKNIMLRILYALLRSRITGINIQWNQLPGQVASEVVVEEAVVAEDMKLPKMDLRARVRYASQMNMFGLRLLNMGAPISIAGHDPRWWPIPDYFQWDTASENAIADGLDGGGSYFERYSQGPCDLWHGLPRMAKTDEITLATPVDDEREDNNLGHGTTTGPSGQVLTQPKAIPGWFSGDFTAYNAPHVGGDADLVPISQMPYIPANRFGVDPAQWNGFPFAKYDSSISYQTRTGKVLLPLSRERPDPILGTGVSTPAYLLQTSAAVSLHAPQATRIIKGTIGKQNSWPKVPFPKDEYRDVNGQVEVLLSKKVVLGTPRLDTDNTTMLYDVHFEYVYGLTADPTRKLVVSPDRQYSLRAGSSPVDKTTSLGNRVSVLDVFNFDGEIDDVANYAP